MYHACQQELFACAHTSDLKMLLPVQACSIVTLHPAGYLLLLVQQAALS